MKNEITEKQELIIVTLYNNFSSIEDIYKIFKYEYKTPIGRTRIGEILKKRNVKIRDKISAGYLGIINRQNKQKLNKKK